MSRIFLLFFRGKIECIVYFILSQFYSQKKLRYLISFYNTFFTGDCHIKSSI